MGARHSTVACRSLGVGCHVGPGNPEEFLDLRCVVRHEMIPDGFVVVIREEVVCVVAQEALEGAVLDSHVPVDGTGVIDLERPGCAFRVRALPRPVQQLMPEGVDLLLEPRYLRRGAHAGDHPGHAPPRPDHVLQGWRVYRHRRLLGVRVYPRGLPVQPFPQYVRSASGRLHTISTLGRGSISSSCLGHFSLGRCHLGLSGVAGSSVAGSGVARSGLAHRC